MAPADAPPDTASDAPADTSPDTAPDAPADTTSRRAAPLPPAERRRAIVDAVLPLLTELGPSATSRQIAEAAGVSEGTVFNVFRDKDELVEAVVATALDPEPIERAIRRIDPTLPFEERLVAATELLQNRIVDVWRLLSQLTPHHRHPSGRPRLPEHPGLAELLGADASRLRIPPSDAAQLLRALTLACTHPMLTTRPRSPREIVDQFLHGAAAGVEPASPASAEEGAP